VATVTTKCSGAVAKQSHGGAKGACRHISPLTIKSVWEMRGACKKVWKSESYIEGEARSPL